MQTHRPRNLHHESNIYVCHNQLGGHALANTHALDNSVLQ